MSIREKLGAVVNLPLIMNPMNWVIVWVILLFAAYAAFTVASHYWDEAPPGD